MVILQDGIPGLNALFLAHDPNCRSFAPEFWKKISNNILDYKQDTLGIILSTISCV